MFQWEYFMTAYQTVSFLDNVRNKTQVMWMTFVAIDPRDLIGQHLVAFKQDFAKLSLQSLHPYRDYINQLILTNMDRSVK